MRTTFIIFIAVLLLNGCSTNRSISSYGQGYNRSYMGEISQLAFLRSVSAADAENPKGTVAITAGSRTMVIQSGQAFPDRAFVEAIQKHVEMVPISGNPEIGGSESGSYLNAAKAGGVDYIIAYWGNIRTTVDQHIRIEISAIIVDVKQGIWTNALAVSDEAEEAYSFFNPQRADDKQVVALKKQVYQRLTKALFP